MKLVRNASVYSHGVSVKHEICEAMYKIDRLHVVWTDREAEFTSIVDGIHSPKSLHYLGLASDLRIWYVNTGKLEAFTEAVEDLLGVSYFVLLEKDHMHISFRPTR